LLTNLLAALAEPSPRTRNAVGADVLAEFLALPITEQLKAIEADLARLPEQHRGDIVKAMGPMLQTPFIPLPGPQTMALNSEADELLFGGAAGGSKSYLLLGNAATRHHRSLILRRQSTELDGLIADLHEMLGRDGWRYEGNGGTFNSKGRSIRLGGCREPDDWRDYAGRPRDFLGIDEAGEFLEEQVSSLIGWVRSTDPKQRCRVILASNPPRGAEGQWLIEWFAPWLDPSFPDMARPGELRWFVGVKGKARWVGGPGAYEIDGEQYTARSRTFIPALLDDNPFLARTDYRATLQSLPEPLRSQLLKGDFLAGREDDAWQVIPSDWIRIARQRWHDRPPEGVPMTAIGVDIAQGGSDQTVLAPRHGTWFAPLQVHEGIDTKDGPSVAALVFALMRDGCGIAVDLGGGWGGSTYDHLTSQEITVDGVVPSSASQAMTRDGKLGFFNRRAELWWKFREALDPQTGSYIALPPDPALVADLTAPRWKLSARGVQVELKEEIRKRLGRSPDRGDAVVMSWGCKAEPKVVRLVSEQLQTHANVSHTRIKRYARR
jgi:hypothetical protein